MKRAHPIGIILWMDGLAALIVGLLVLSLRKDLSILFNLPEALLYAQAVTTLVYASYSTTLARKKIYSRKLVRVLGIANLAYVVGVIILFILTLAQTTTLGKAYFGAEIVGISALATIELKQLKYL